MPALAKFMAMPPPIVPAPMMPAVLIVALRRVGRHVEHLGGLALGEEVVALRRRLGEVSSSWNSSRSRLMPSSNGSSTAACTHLMMLHGALKPRARRAIAFSVSLNRSGDSSVALRSRTRRRGAFCATSIWACATAPASRSPSTMASMMPLLLASGAGMWRPEMMASSAYFAPVRRGRRCVPPAPGRMPRWTSGRPTRVVASDTR